jgi:hypothetical protein
MPRAAARARLRKTEEESMSNTAVQNPTAERTAVPRPVPGTTFFGLMVAAWTTLVTLLAVSPETLADFHDWIRELALVWEILMWILVLPWALAYWAWESSWEQWVRVAVVALIAVVHLSITAPRVPR